MEDWVSILDWPNSSSLQSSTLTPNLQKTLSPNLQKTLSCKHFGGRRPFNFGLYVKPERPISTFLVEFDELSTFGHHVNRRLIVQ